MRIRLHHLIFIGLALGVVVGVLMWGVSDETKASNAYQNSMWVLDLIGKTLFIGALKMIIAPLILFSIVAGVTSLPNVAELGRIGWKTLVYYIGTTTIAVAIGLVLVLTLQPGKKPASVNIREARQAELQKSRNDFAAETGKDAKADHAEYLAWLQAQESTEQLGGAEAGRWKRVTKAEERTPGDIFRDDIIKPLLTNPFEALSKRISLGIIFFALLFGVACMAVGEQAKPIVEMFHAGNAAIMKLTTWIMSLSPVAIACLMASLVAKHGPEVFQSLGWYCITVIGGILIHVTILFLIANFVGRVSPRQLVRGIRDAWLIAFTTRSSAATLPVTIKCVTEKMKISKQTANFVLPVGATVNMDGTALYEGVAIIYLLQIYGGLDDVTVTMGGMVTFLVFITAVLASVGAAAVPDAGLVTMVLVASAVHLPVYYIPLIFAVDAFLDMFRTSTNVLGDTVGCTVIERLEGKRLRELSPEA